MSIENNSTNYGQFIAKVIDGILWSYTTYGSYQGDYIAIVEKDSALHIYKGYYGSCSGCDWLEGAGEYSEDDDSSIKIISDVEIQEFMKDFEPFLVIPKDCIPDTTEELKTLLPANSRIWLDDEDATIEYTNLLEQIKNPQFKNLEYLEAKYDKNKSL